MARPISGREQRRHDTGRRPGERHRHALALENGRGIGAEAEEGGGRERRIAGHAADEVPGQREHGIHRKRWCRAAAHSCRRRAAAARAAATPTSRIAPVPHSKPRRPSRPVGRTARMTMSSANDTVIAYSGPSQSAEKLSIRPSSDAADHGAGHAAQPAQHADHEGLAEEERAVERRDRIDDAEQAAGGTRHERADPEGDGVHAHHVDAHQRGGLAIHAHGDDGAADPAERAAADRAAGSAASASTMTATRSSGRNTGPSSSEPSGGSSTTLR